MKYKIRYNEFLKTFTKNQIDSIVDFRTVKKLHAKGFSKMQISQKIAVSKDKLYQWRYTRIKPIPIKIIETALEKGYLDYINEKQLEILAYLIGFNLGDGNVSRNLCHVWFYGVNSDLGDVKDKLKEFGVTPIIYTYKINNGKMAVHDHVFSRFLVCLGAVAGDKTKTAFGIPNWVISSGIRSPIKHKFLQGFFDSELGTPKLMKTGRFSHQNMSLYSIKEKHLVKEGILFLNQIRNLLMEFSVYSSEPRLDRRYIRGRDGGEMQQLYFIINSNYINLYNFINNIGFLYNSKRKAVCEQDFSKIKSLAQFEIEKNKKYVQAIKLRKRGLSAYEIASRLGIQSYHVKNWVYFGRKPRLYVFCSKNRASIA